MIGDRGKRNAYLAPGGRESKNLGLGEGSSLA